MFLALTNKTFANVRCNCYNKLTNQIAKTTIVLIIITTTISNLLRIVRYVWLRTRKIIYNYCYLFLVRVDCCYNNYYITITKNVFWNIVRKFRSAMCINLEKLEKIYIYIYYIDRRSKVFVAHKLIVLRLYVLINCNCLLFWLYTRLIAHSKLNDKRFRLF